ncbi:MAG TPA: tripartite tricarboxylate transporter substrate binding protein [Burkholderiales bacterium]|nr:tripartite tricarboxylate transporter substrate binding protein [Burkholderiales bacterium]
MNRFSASVTVALSFFAVLTQAPDARAQTFPAKAITLIVPFPAGGRTDLTARAIAEAMRDDLRQPIVVVNKPGASGVLGAKEVAAAAPDGYTLCLFSTGFLTAQYTLPTPTTVKEYELISLINFDPAALAASSMNGWTSLTQVITAGKAKPKSLRIGINPGNSAHIFAGAFVRAVGLDVLFVPFKGGSERATAIAGGHIDLDFDIVAPMKPLLDAGKLRVLGVAAERRVDLYPQIPTFKEQGVDLLVYSWHGIFAPKGTPAPVLATVDASLQRISRNAKFLANMEKLLLGVRYMNRQEFADFFADQDAQFRPLIQNLGLMVKQ